jgi:polyhydroxyalkanoate synthesis regulator phasin
VPRKSKKGTPAWVDDLLKFREEITEEEYKEYWHRLNRVRKNENKWNKEGEEIIREILDSKNIFRAKDFASVAEAKHAAEIRQADEGGKILRRDTSGRFSKRGHTFQVIRANK